MLSVGNLSTKDGSMKAFLLGTLVLAASPAWAQKITVKKVKGNQAVIQINGGAVKVGQSFDLSKESPGGEDLELVGSNTGPRNKVLGFSSTVASTTSQVGNGKSSNTEYGATFKYGWNKGAFEFGFNALFNSSDSGSGATASFGGGGFFDWNFKANRPGNDMIFGLGGDLNYTIVNPPQGQQSSNRMTIYPSAFMKWFVLGTPTAIRFDAGYLMDELGSGSAKTKINGFVIRGGFAVYF